MNTRPLTFDEMLVPGRVLISRRQLLQKVPLCERMILDMEKEGRFPRRFVISTRHVVWDLAEIDAWIQKRKEAGIQPPAPGLQAPKALAKQG